MNDLGWVDLGVQPDAGGFGTSLSRQIDPDLDRVGRQAGRRFSSGFKKIAAAGAGAAFLAGAAAIKFGADALGEADEARKVGAQTEAVIKSTGEAAKVSADQVGDLSGRLSNMAAVDDELIQSGANVLLTFTKIRNEAGKGNKIFDLATKAALNMSAALKKDLSGSAVQVGKALNDPVKGVTALAKAGVQFTAQQRAQIKALVEGGDANAAMAVGLIDSTTTYNNLLKENGNDATKVARILKSDLTPAQKKAFDMYAEGGKTMEAQKRIIKELDTQFAGSAKSQATESDKLKVAYGNLKEEIGTELLPYMDDLSRFIRKEGIPAVRDFAGWVREDGVPAIKKIAGFTKDAASATKDLIGFLDDLPDPAKYAGIVALLGGIGAVKLRGGGKGVLGTVGSIAGVTKPVPVIVTNPGFGAPGTTPTPDGKPPGKGLGAGTAATLAALGLPLLDDQYKKNPLLTSSGDWAEELGNKLGLPDWFAGDTAGMGRPNGAPTPEQLEEMTAKLRGFYDSTGDLGGGESAPDLKRLADGLKDTGEEAWGAARMFDGFTGAARDGKRETDRLRGSMEKLGMAKVRPQVDTSSIEAALALFRQLPGMEGVVGPVDPSLLPASPRAGVVIDQRNSTIVAHDYDDFVKKSGRKAQRAGLGGRPYP